MLDSRRDLLRWGLTMPVAGAITANAHTRPGHDWKDKISPAITSAVNAAAMDIYRGRAAHKLRAADLRRFSTSFAIMSAHLKEIGAVPDIRRAFEASGLLTVPAGREQLVRLRHAGAKHGVLLGEEQFEDYVGAYERNWPAFVAEFHKGGIQALNATVASAFENCADHVEKYDNGTLVSGTQLRVVPTVMPICDELGFGLAVSGVYLGTWGIMLQAGLIAIPFFGWIVVGATMIGAISGMFCA